MSKNKGMHWLEKRLNEIGKSKKEFASSIGIQAPHVSAILSGIRKIQTTEISKAALFLKFDRTAFLDFLSGDITEEQLWQAKPPQQISESDMALLNAVKTLAIHTKAEETVKDTNKPQKLPDEKER